MRRVRGVREMRVASGRLALAALLLSSLATCSVSEHDEFASPTHTPAVQLLAPRHGAQLPANEEVRVFFAAPEGSIVRILLDGSEVRAPAQIANPIRPGIPGFQR
jgi:hypothetical protein